MPRFSDITGRTFGRWTVERYMGRSHWSCICECGTRRLVYGSTLRNHRSISCGCFRAERNSVEMSTHGYARKGRIYSEWNIWSGMKQRCYNPNNDCYQNYGARGITVCERWRSSFQSFIDDMGFRPTGHTLDRINNDGPYSPENCRWTTRKQQGRNTRKNRRITFDGTTRTLSEWAEHLLVDADTIAMRLDRSGWTVEKALTTPVK